MLREAGQRRALFAILLIGVLSVMIVVLAAYAAELKVDNNRMEAANASVQNEIDTLDIKIKSANSIDHIEDVAINQLGMVYAEENECVYLSQTDAPTDSLALIIRENAYH